MKSRTEYAKQRERNIACAREFCTDYLKQTDITEKMIRKCAKAHKQVMKLYRDFTKRYYRYKKRFKE